MPYILAQVSGAIVGTLFVYGAYGQSFSIIEAGMTRAGKANQIISVNGPAGVGAILPGVGQDLGR